LLKRLQALPHGYLEIEDGDDLHRFGNPDGNNHVHAKMVIKDASAYRDIAFGGSLGGGEAYMLDKWSTPNMLKLVRLMCINIDFLNQMDRSTPLLQRAGDRLFHWLNSNTEKQARDNISRHYDLSNDFFSLFLDPDMMYSAAIFERPEMSLEQASIHKLDVICHKLELQPEDHLLEIGTGWGGLAVYAARHFGCRVTAVVSPPRPFRANNTRPLVSACVLKVWKARLPCCLKTIETCRAVMTSWFRWR
jgi:cyclopropane-fatty-acyl-phospholipid synthase